MPPSFQQRKKKSTSRYASRCCCGLALPRSTHLIFCFTTSDPRLSRLDCMRNILGPAAREPASTVGYLYMWIPSWAIVEDSAVCSLLCEEWGTCRRGLMQVQSVKTFRRMMQVSTIWFLNLDFQGIFVDSLQQFAVVFTHRWICARCSQLVHQRRPLLSKCCEDFGSNTQMCFRSHIHLAGGSQEVGTHDARLPVATPRRAFWIGGNGLSSLRAQTLGQLTSNVPEWSFNIQARTAYTRSELDPPTLHCGSPVLALATTHISTRRRGEHIAWEFAGSTSTLFRNLRGAVVEGHPGNLACSRAWRYLSVSKQPGLFRRLRPLPRA